VLAAALSGSLVDDSKHIVRCQRAPDPLQLELTHQLDLHCILNLHQHSGTDEDLSRLSSCAAEAEFLIQPMKPHLDGASAHTGIALAVDDVIVWVGIALVCSFRKA
jgi:hypothetical protein